MTTYISGPITGYPELNKPAFDAAQARLEANGLKVCNPHCVPAPQTNLQGKALWQYYMRECVRLMLDCDQLYMLANWQNSQGAVWEKRIADMLGIPVVYEHVPD